MKIKKSVGDRWKRASVQARRFCVPWISLPPFLVVLIAAILSAGPVHTARAQILGEYTETYTARLSPADHYNSNGVRLHSAAAIIRQDRANYYVYGIAIAKMSLTPFLAPKVTGPAWSKCLKMVERHRMPSTKLSMERP